MFYYATLVVATALFFGCPTSPVSSVSADADASAPADAGPADAGETTSLPEDTGSVDVGDTADETGGPPSTLDFEVTEAGPYAVGYRTWDITYTPLGADEPRTIGVHAWYPASVAEGEPPRYAGLFLDEEAFTDAPLAPPVDGSSYPVWVHSHGHQAYAGNSSALMRFVATHGWVAVAPDHVGDMLADSSTSETLAHFLERPQDITAALNAVAEDPQWMLADTTRVVLSGHSRGVYTVWASSGAAYDVGAIEADWPDITAEERQLFADGLGDPRVVASVGLAGGYRASWYGGSGYTAVTVPMLTMSGSQDNPEGFQTQWDTLTGIPMTWVEIEGACHQAFALGTCNDISAEEGFRLVNAYSLAFARRHLLEDTTVEGLLDGSAVISQKVTVQVR